MDQKRYPESKWKFISEMPDERYLGFCKQVPRAKLMEALQGIKIQGGFRGDQELQKKIGFVRKNLFSGNVKDMGRARDGHASVWAAWINTQAKLYDLLKPYDNSLDREIPPNTDVDVGCFALLLQYAIEKKISRKTVVDFNDFGYFLPDPRIDKLIAQFPEAFEEEVLAEKVAEVEEAPRAEASESARLRAMKEHLAKLRDDQKELEERTKNIGISLDNEKGRISRVETGIDNVKEALKKDRESTDETTEILSTEIRRLDSNLKEMRDFAGGLDKKLSSLEKRLTDLGAKIQNAVNTSSDTVPKSSAKPHQIAPSTKIREFSNLDHAYELLSDNFHKCGMTAQSSGYLASDVLTGVLSGQCTIFSGSYSTEVAMAAAASFSQGNVLAIDLPLGLNDGEFLQYHFESFLRRRDPGALIIRGINRCAVEVSAAAILENVRANSRDRKCSNFPKIVFATLTPLPGGLPIYSSLTELGPIFDMDSLNWTPKGTIGDFRSAKFSANFQAELRQVWDHSQTTLNEGAEEWRKVMEPTANIAWKDLLHSATGTLEKVPGTEISAKSIGLICGWLLPRAHCNGWSASKARSAVREYWGADTGDNSRISRTLANLMERWS